MQKFLLKVKPFLFNNEYFEQINGVPMGSKASNLLADIIMKYIIDNDKVMDITPSQYKPFVLYISQMIASVSGVSSRSGAHREEDKKVFNQKHGACKCSSVITGAKRGCGYYEGVSISLIIKSRFLNSRKC